MAPALRWNERQGSLSIPEHLLAALHLPAQLVAQREDEYVVVLYLPGDKRVRPDSKVRKVSYPNRAVPRIQIGPDPAKELGLVDGWWRAEVHSNCIVGTFGPVTWGGIKS